MIRWSILMAILWVCSAPYSLVAQEQLGGEELFEETTPGTHAGLLGKRYLQAMYVQHQLNDSFVSRFDDSLQGFDTTLNLPVLKSGQFGKFGLDAFAGYGRLSLGGSTYFGPPVNSGLSLHGTGESYFLGTSLYTTVFGPIRPFTRLGVAYSEGRATLSSGVASFTETSYDTQFRLVLGTEADLTSYAALRFSFDVETEEQFGNSAFASELIVWPLERVFLRGGMITPLNAEGIGGAVGAGIQF